jgi:hypothetical protein
MTTTVLEGPHTAAQQRAERTGRIDTPARDDPEQPDDDGTGTGPPPRFPPVDDRHGRGGGGGGPGVPRLGKILVLAGILLLAIGLMMASLEGGEW